MPLHYLFPLMEKKNYVLFCVYGNIDFHNGLAAPNKWVIQLLKLQLLFQAPEENERQYQVCTVAKFRGQLDPSLGSSPAIYVSLSLNPCFFIFKMRLRLPIP